VTEPINLVRPPALKKGDLIGLAAPAGPFELERFLLGVQRLQSYGWNVDRPDQIFEEDGYLAGSDENRASTLNDLLATDRIQAVIAARGGYGCLRLLDRLNWRTLARKPKIVCGFSDVTTLLLALYREIKWVTIHGPVITSMAEADDETMDHLYRLITGQPVFPLTLDPEWIFRPGRAEGPLLGGNLTLLVHLLAAGRLPDLSGSLLLLEDVGEAPYRLDRMMTTLNLAGVLKSCAGLLLGDFKDCGTEDEVRGVMERVLDGFAGPVVFGFPAGHGIRNLALPLGPRALLDASTGLLDFQEPYLAE
jgi:muramoyltetrapeptide carboxypeptidase